MRKCFMWTGCFGGSELLVGGAEDLQRVLFLWKPSDQPERAEDIFSIPLPSGQSPTNTNSISTASTKHIYESTVSSVWFNHIKKLTRGTTDLSLG